MIGVRQAPLPPPTPPPTQRCAEDTLFLVCPLSALLLQQLALRLVVVLVFSRLIVYAAARCCVISVGGLHGNRLDCMQTPAFIFCATKAAIKGLSAETVRAIPRGACIVHFFMLLSSFVWPSVGL